MLEKKPFPQLTFFFLKIYFPFQLMKIFQASAFWSSGNIFKTPTIFFLWLGKKRFLFPQRSSSFLILKLQNADLQIIHSYRKPEIMVTALQPHWCQLWCQGYHWTMSLSAASTLFFKKSRPCDEEHRIKNFFHGFGHQKMMPHTHWKY